MAEPLSKQLYDNQPRCKTCGGDPNVHDAMCEGVAMAEERQETGMEHIARDIREGRFPQRSEPQTVEERQPDEKLLEELQRFAYAAYDIGFLNAQNKRKLATFSGFCINYWPLKPLAEKLPELLQSIQAGARQEIIERLNSWTGRVGHEDYYKTQAKLLELEQRAESAEQQLAEARAMFWPPADVNETNSLDSGSRTAEDGRQQEHRSYLPRGGSV